MKKIFGLSSLMMLNCSGLYLIYQNLYIACSTKIDNIFHIPYEPSGMQLFYYFISFPLFMILASLSQLHSYYFDLRKSLSLCIVIIWGTYFILFLCVDFVAHYPIGNEILYYGSLIISLIAIFYIINLTYTQLTQFFNSQI